VILCLCVFVCLSLAGSIRMLNVSLEYSVTDGPKAAANWIVMLS